MVGPDRDGRHAFFPASALASEGRSLPSVSAMVPMTPEDAQRLVVNPLATAAEQTKKAAQIRADSRANGEAAEILSKCCSEVSAAMNTKGVVNEPPAVEEEVSATRAYRF